MLFVACGEMLTLLDDECFTITVCEERICFINFVISATCQCYFCFVQHGRCQNLKLLGSASRTVKMR